MGHPDHFDGPVPERPLPASPSPFAEPDVDRPGADADDAPRKVSARLAWRAFRRHWWQALLLWTAGSAALMALAYVRVKPSYEAIAQLSIEPGEQALFTKNMSQGNFTEYRESQVTLVTSPVVLGLALTDHPELYNAPRLRQAADAEMEIRHALQVQIVKGTSQIQVALSSESAQEATDIVNAVVNAYIAYAQKTNNEEARRRVQNLKAVEDESAQELERKRQRVQTIREQSGKTTIADVKSADRATVEQYKQWSEELSQIQVRRFAAQARLDQVRGEPGLAGPPGSEGETREAVVEAFQADSRVSRILEHRARIEKLHGEGKRVARSRTDAAVVRYRRAIDADNAQLRDLWERLAPSIERRLRHGSVEGGGSRTAAEAELELKGLVAQEQALKRRLEQITVKNAAEKDDALSIEFAQSDMKSAEQVLDTVRANLKQLEYEAKGSVARIRLDYAARPSNRPRSNHRIKVLAAVPIGVWFGVLGLLTLVELRSGRVADPDELPSRLRLPVLGVVPPLPPSRVLPGRDDLRARRRLDEFVQSLDHLRVALCAHRDPWNRDRRCVLITSACGGEGKTTLAAQLAERCVNAGLMTLLIDADLRSPSLSRMLDAGDAPGLVNVLRDDCAPEEAMRVVHAAGGFHFMPAGTPRVDPSRVLQGDQLGHLLARARESFDIVIADAPPVLPVPDALTIGRWVDGALLAVRYDTSRFPLVERAHKRLAHVGVTVFGAVVNGVRSPDGSYGSYQPDDGAVTAEPVA